MDGKIVKNAKMRIIEMVLLYSIELALETFQR
jgi:hypothetical protein